MEHGVHAIGRSKGGANTINPFGRRHSLMKKQKFLCDHGEKSRSSMPSIDADHVGEIGNDELTTHVMDVSFRVGVEWMMLSLTMSLLPIAGCRS
jgi:hypothetical protein